MTNDEEALARLRATHPYIWRPERWMHEAVTLGVALGGLLAFAYFCALLIIWAGGLPVLVAALS